MRLDSPFTLPRVPSSCVVVAPEAVSNPEVSERCLQRPPKRTTQHLANNKRSELHEQCCQEIMTSAAENYNLLQFWQQTLIEGSGQNRTEYRRVLI